MRRHVPAAAALILSLGLAQSACAYTDVEGDEAAEGGVRDGGPRYDGAAAARADGAATGDARAIADGGASGGDGAARADAPAAGGEVCDDGLDNDRDGDVDEDCTCMPGETQRCFDGDPDLAGNGPCARGTQTCVGGGEIGTWGACTGSGAPRAEVCNDMDDDCDGTPDNGVTCVCNASERRACYTGPAGTSGVGACHAGTQACLATEMGWGACGGQVVPRAEICGNRVDDDCDGMTDEGCTCIGTGAAPWQEVLDPMLYCYGRDLDRDAAEFAGAWVRIPAEGDARWRSRGALAIDFDAPSTFRSPFCMGAHTGGVFSYFQTFVTIPGRVPASVVVRIGSVDDGTQVRVYNAIHPTGYTQAGWIRFDGGSTTNIAAHLVTGRNRIVIVHVDDNPSTRALGSAQVLFDGRALTGCR